MVNFPATAGMHMVIFQVHCLFLFHKYNFVGLVNFSIGQEISFVSIRPVTVHESVTGFDILFQFMIVEFTGTGLSFTSPTWKRKT